MEKETKTLEERNEEFNEAMRAFLRGGEKASESKEVALEELIKAHSDAKRAMKLASKRAVNTEDAHNVAQVEKLEAEKNLKKAAKVLCDALVSDDEFERIDDESEKVDDTQYAQDFWTRMFQPPTTFDNMFTPFDQVDYRARQNMLRQYPYCFPNTGITWKS